MSVASPFPDVPVRDFKLVLELTAVRPRHRSSAMRRTFTAALTSRLPSLAPSRDAV